MEKEFEVTMIVKCEERFTKYIANAVCDGLEKPTCVKHIEIKELITN